MKKKLENIVPDIYKALTPLAKGNGLDLSDEMIEELDSEEILKAQQLSNEIFNKINKNGG